MNEKIKQLIEIQKKHKLTDAIISNKIGIAATTYTALISGDIDYDPGTDIWRLVDKYLEELNQEIYETELVKKMYRVLKTTYEDKEISVVTSVSGAGKTTAISQFCKTNPNAVHIRVVEIMTSKYLLEMMMKELGNPAMGMTNQFMYETVSELLIKKPMLVVIDEAERLKVSQLELLRDLYDQGHMGLALVGLKSLTVLLQKGRSLKEDLTQLYSRVGYHQILDVLKPNDVKMIFASKFGRHDVSERVMAALASKYKMKGSLRAIIKIANLAIKTASANEGRINKINDDVIEHCIEEISL